MRVSNLKILGWKWESIQETKKICSKLYNKELKEICSNLDTKDITYHRQKTSLENFETFSQW